MDVADQYSTDQYQVWGQYFSTPFYPTKQNALMPAQTPANKIGVVTIQWATRDPYNGYGNGATDSTYSVQVNDYLLHKLDVNYFEKILAIYPQVTVGLENDFNWDKNGPEYTKQIHLLKSKQQQGQLVLKTMSEFAVSYQAIHPNLSPNVLIYASDPLGTDGKVVWYQNPRYRIGLFYKPEEGLFIRDLRTYSDGAQELCFTKACEKLGLAFSPIQVVDDVNFGSKWVIDQGKLKDWQVSQKDNSVELSYLTPSGHRRVVTLSGNDRNIVGF